MRSVFLVIVAGLIGVIILGLTSKEEGEASTRMCALPSLIKSAQLVRVRADEPVYLSWKAEDSCSPLGYAAVPLRQHELLQREASLVERGIYGRLDCTLQQEKTVGEVRGVYRCSTVRSSPEERSWEYRYYVVLWNPEPKVPSAPALRMNQSRLRI